MLRTRGVLILISGLSLSGASNVFGSVLEVFSIGRKDRSFAEFARERDPGRPVIYRVGDSSPAKDWYAYQPGSFDYQVGRSSMEQDWVVMNPGSSGSLAKDPAPVPFEIVFSLPSTPKGAFSLHLDAIFRYRRPAAPRYVVEINGKSGSYQLAPQPAPELWWPWVGKGEGGFNTLVTSP